MNIKGLTVYNITKATWFDYYLGVTESEQEVIDNYGTKEELSDICQMTADITNEGFSNKLGKVTIALFEGMGNWLEVGFTECSDEFKKSLEDADAIELDIDGIGFDGSTLKEDGYEISEDAFTKGNIIEVMTTIANFVNDVVLNNKTKNEKLITEAPDQYGLPTDDEIEAEERAEFEKRLADRKAQRDADFKKKDDERISKEKAEQRKAELKAKADEVIKELGTKPDFKDAFEKLVPSSGPCESIGAELIRAVNRLEYRWWNDGDKFYDGYGLETCGSPAAFIYDNADEYDAETGEEIVSLLVKTAEKDGGDSDYDEFIDALKEKIIKLVFEESPELLAEPLGKDDIHSWATSPEDYWGSYVPTQEWEIEVSDKVKYYLDRSDVDSWAIVDYILNHIEDVVSSNIKNVSVNRPYTNADETYTVTNLSKDAYNELENIDTDEFWSDLEQDLEDDYGPVVYTEDIEDQCYERLENLKSDFEAKGFDIDISGVSVSYDYGDYICEFDLTVNGQYLGGVDFTFTITADEIDADEFDIDAEANIEDKIETDYEEDSEEESNESLKKESLSEAFTGAEQDEFMELAKELNLNTMKDVLDFSAEHNNVKDQELLQAMRDAVNSNKNESLKESVRYWPVKYKGYTYWINNDDDTDIILYDNDGVIITRADSEKQVKDYIDNLTSKKESLKEEFTTIEDAFKSVNGNKKVFDKDGYFVGDTYEKFAQKVADKFFNGNVDELDKVCEEEHCFKESLKEDYNYDEDAFYQAYNDGDIYCQIVKDDDDDDFMIVDDYEEIQKIQKLLSPNFEPKDKYDTSVLDNFMSWGFSDSYCACDNCGKLIGTEPDSKHWTPDFFISDNGIICGDCVRKDPSEYLQSLANNPDSANTILSESDLEDAGFVKLDGDYQNGWYDRQDDPKSILNDLLDRFPYGVFIFNITTQAQFATNFDVWGEEATLEEYDDEEETDESLKEASLNERMTDTYESDNFIAKCEFKPGRNRNYFYVHLIDKGNNREYAKGSYGWINRPYEGFNYKMALLDACRKYGLSDEKIDSLREKTTFQSTLDLFDELVNGKKSDKCLKEEDKKSDATIKIKPNSKKVEVEIPDKSKAGEEGNSIQQGLKGRVNKLEDVNESANSMADAVSKNTKDFTKEKGQMICNKGAQQKDAESTLKKHYSNVEFKPAKGGRISISFSGLTKNEALNEEESKNVITLEEAKELCNDIYNILEDNGIYPEFVGPAQYDDVTGEIQVVISGDWKWDHSLCDNLVEDLIAGKGYKIVSIEEDAEHSDTDSYKSTHSYYFEKENNSSL